MRNPLRGRAAAALATAAALVGASLTLAAPASASAPDGVLSVTPVTEVGSYGQQVTHVVLEYGADVDATALTAADFRVEDSVYNFRFHGIERLPELVDRDVADVWTTDDPARLLTEDSPVAAGRYVVLELADSPDGGWTVIVSRCPTFLCSVRVNPDLLTQVTQLGDVRATDGTLLAAADPGTAHRVTAASIDREVDQFELRTFTSSTGDVEYAYRLPDGYDPSRRYPLVVALPGHGMGFDGQNLGVQLASDMLTTAWFQEEWTGTDEDVIVLAPQNERVGKAVEGAQTIELVEAFLAQHAVDRTRVYATSVSYGSQLLWEMFSERPDLFAGGLLTGGFPADADELPRIAAAQVPLWITHGTSDHLLPVANARASYDGLVAAYRALGHTEARIAELVRWTEYGDDAFTLPDHHLASAPTYEDPRTLQWLLAQRQQPRPAFAVEVGTQCHARWAVPTVTVTNEGDERMRAVVSTGPGSEKTLTLPAGKEKSHRFTHRSAQLPAGTVTVTVETAVDGVAVTETRSYEHAALDCR